MINIENPMPSQILIENAANANAPIKNNNANVTIIDSNMYLFIVLIKYI